MKSNRDIRKIKNKKHQISLSYKGTKIRKRKISVCNSAEIIPIDFSCNSYTSTQIKKGHCIQKGFENIVDPQTGKEIGIQLLLEYSALYPEKMLNLTEEIRFFSREELIDMFRSLVCHSGEWKVSDLTKEDFFSSGSKEFIDRMVRIQDYIKKNNTTPHNVSYACHRTLLEFLKLIFGVTPEECKNSIKRQDSNIAGVKFFDILLAINEQKITPFVTSTAQNADFSRLFYSLLYAGNEFENINYKLCYYEQMYCARSFFEFITSREEYKGLYQTFIESFEINSWKDYFRTMLILILIADKKKEVYINIVEHKRLCENVLRKLSINQEEYIKIDNNDDENRDFVKFRSCPLIRMNNGDYIVYDKILLIRRLYNSLYFDLQSCGFKYRGKSFSQFYKEVFVEKFLFDRTMLFCLENRNIASCFPAITDINQDDFVDRKEAVDQPDFYFREGNDVFVFECKAVKLNGNLKSNLNVEEIIAELKNKLCLKTWSGKYSDKKELKQPKNVGVGQLVKHIESIETNNFQWDEYISENALYYPVLVLESSEISLFPLSSILNEWYLDLLEVKSSIQREKCRPVIVMTIRILFLFSDLFSKNGFKYYFDKFFADTKSVEIDGSYSMNAFIDFETWMCKTYKSSPEKQIYIKKIGEELLKNES